MPAQSPLIGLSKPPPLLLHLLPYSAARSAAGGEFLFAALVSCLACREPLCFVVPSESWVLLPYLLLVFCHSPPRPVPNPSLLPMLRLLPLPLPLSLPFPVPLLSPLPLLFPLPLPLLLPLPPRYRYLYVTFIFTFTVAVAVAVDPSRPPCLPLLSPRACPYQLHRNSRSSPPISGSSRDWVSSDILADGGRSPARRPLLVLLSGLAPPHLGSDQRSVVAAPSRYRESGGNTCDWCVVPPGGNCCHQLATFSFIS